MEPATDPRTRPAFLFDLDALWWTVSAIMCWRGARPWTREAPGIGLVSGGYGREELEKAGACQVYQDPADLLLHLDEVGARNG